MTQEKVNSLKAFFIKMIKDFEGQDSAYARGLVDAFKSSLEIVEALEEVEGGSL